MTDYHNSSLWVTAFGGHRRDHHQEARAFFCSAYERFRNNVIPLVERIAAELPQLTLHDISHLDALWEVASEIAGKGYDLNPAEAFVFGGAILLHDAALSAAAYSDGMDEIRKTDDWRDCAVLVLRERGLPINEEAINNPPSAILNQILFSVLRDRHAEQAERLATMGWPVPDSHREEMHLIDTPELRVHYGEQIGRIAHSHHWDAAALIDELQREIPAIALANVDVPNTWVVDGVKVACLLRTADAAHIDGRRAPRQYRIFNSPDGLSVEHWKYQERLGKARFDPQHNALRFGSGKKFDLSDADAWWMCFDTIQIIDRELRDADKLLSSCELKRFAAQHVLDSETPSLLCRHVRTNNWLPVDAKVQISDVTNIVKKFGGERLYGHDPSVALRELVQNAADAIRARRKLERNPQLGVVEIRLIRRGDEFWLEVEDDGVGMAEHVLTGALLDFGRSFWGSERLHKEWPGLAGSGFLPSGRFGIGFFAVFMLGDQVTVTTRRFDQGVERARTLEFRHGLDLRPILRSADAHDCVLHGGTCVSVKLKTGSHECGRIFRKTRDYGPLEPADLAAVVGWLCPSIDVDLWVQDLDSSKNLVVRANDWMSIPAADFISRISTHEFSGDINDVCKRMELISSGNVIFGRGALAPELWGPTDDHSVVTVGGIRAESIRNFVGLLTGDIETLSRHSAKVEVPCDAMARWATSQETYLEKQSIILQACAADRLECFGAEPSKLRWCRLGTRACNTAEFISAIAKLSHVAVTESIVEQRYGITAQVGDRVTAQELIDGFVPEDDLVQLFEHPGILANETTSLDINEADNIYPGVMRLFVRCLGNAWGFPISVERARSRVGRVRDLAISRYATIFRRSTSKNG